MGVIRRHLVQNLHSTVDHLPQSSDEEKKKKGFKFLNLGFGGGIPRSRRSTSLCFGEKQRLVGFVSKERRVVELEEDEAEGERKKGSLLPSVVMDSYVQASCHTTVSGTF